MTALQYQQIVDKYIKQYDIKAKYHSKSTGLAWIASKEIKIPHLVDQFHFYLALHEIGHIAVGIPNSHPTWKHEYAAMNWAEKIANRHDIYFNDELKEGIRGYAKYSIVRACRPNKELAITIPDKVFKMAGINKTKFLQNLIAEKSPCFNIDIKNTADYRNLRLIWKDKK